MKALQILIVIVVVAALAGGAGFWLGRNNAEEKEAGSGESTTQADSGEKQGDEPVVAVETIPLKVSSISETATAFGTIVAEASDLRIQSVPFESRIKHIDVTAGQDASADTKTVQLEASPDALLALEEAKKTLEAATRDLAQTQQRVNDRLVTNQELSQAKQTEDSARLKYASLVDRGVGKTHQLTAGASGVVNKVAVQEGQIVPAGGPLVEIAVGNRIDAKLGVSEEIVDHLRIDQVVRLHRIDQSTEAAVEGKIRLIGRRVDPATHLVEIRVTLPASAHFLLDSSIAGEITIASAEGFVVPRNAALADDAGHYTVFTVKDDHSVKHAVRIGLQSGNLLQIIADDLKPGDSLAVTGNYQLQDGMKVEVKEASRPATTQANKEDRS